MKLIPYNEARHGKKWDEFVMERGTFFHLRAWKKVIERTYAFQPNYCLWEQDGSIAGIFPAFIVKRPFAGRALISNPFSVSAGPLTAEVNDQQAFIEAITAQAKSKNIDYIELRDVHVVLDNAAAESAVEGAVEGGLAIAAGAHLNKSREHWVNHQYFANFEKTLSTDHEANFLSIPNRQRAVIRKAEAYGLSIDHHEDMTRFLSTYATSLRNLGTPIYPKRHFQALLHFFPNQVGLSSVRHEQQDLSTVLHFHFKDKFMPYYGGGINAARHFHSYPWMYWQLMKHGLDQGYTIFDFGRSPINSGAYQFKKNLGFDPRLMNYCYLPLRGSVPDLTHNSGLVQRLTGLWSYLPTPLTKVVGPLGAIYAV